ncbi:MAG: hypothetical protein EPN73_03290 [Paraburkholderia sp.]|nr:MAG: hypothetical protein EPN73_03290 [Paraburkholderia sp.]
MPADKLGRYMTSDLFKSKANAAVERAVAKLRAKGITPAYSTRQTASPSQTSPSCHSPQEPKANEGADDDTATE